jgi:hypothetical protein
MWLYPRPSCPNRPSFEELSVVEIDFRIHKVFDLGVDPNPRAGPAPLQEGFANATVSTPGPALVAYVILSFHHARSLAQGLSGGRDELCDASLPGDAARWEAKNAFKENEPGAPPIKRRRGRGCTPPKIWVLRRGGEKGEITPPTLFSPCITPRPLIDIVY